MSRYEQICVRPYMLIFLQFICTEMDYVVHICAYLCISVHICAYLCISNSTYIWLGEQQNWERMQLEGFVFTESRTAKGNSLVKQDWWNGRWILYISPSIGPYLCICPSLLICLYLWILFESVNMHSTQSHSVQFQSNHASSPISESPCTISMHHLQFQSHAHICAYVLNICSYLSVSH